MLPTKTDVHVTGDLGGKKIAMTIDQNSQVFLANMFIDMYSDPALAVIREYSTNARDAHIEAGCPDKPIEVSTPSDFMPYLKIKDTGIGMNLKDIEDTYSKYGASTKRETNEQNGMLGIGAKSALTFTNQFNVIGIKDGVKTSVSVSRGTDGGGTMEIIGEVPTTEPNGVEIIIPATRQQVDDKVRNFFRFWKPGTVLVNGEQPQHVEGEQIGNFLFVNGLGNDYVVMGNVAYPAPDLNRIYTQSGYGNRDGVVAWVGMGEVNFTPSREALHMTALTKSTLGELRVDFEASVRKHLEEKIEKAATHSEAARYYFKLNETSLKSYAQNLKYKGKVIPRELDFDYIYNVRSATTTPARWTRMAFFFTNRVLILHGYDKEKIHSTHRRKLKIWLETNQKNFDFVMWTNEIPGSPWTDEVDRVHWDDIAAVKIPRNPTNGSVKSEKYAIINSRGYRVEDQDVDTDKDILFASPTEVNTQEAKDKVAEFLVDNDTQFMLVNKNRWKQFKEEFPDAKHFLDEIKERIAEYQANLTDAEKIYLRTDYPDKRMCAKLEAAKVDDPVIKRAIEDLSTDGLSSSIEAKYNSYASAAEHWEIPFQKHFPSNKTKVFEQYPMLNLYGYYDPKYPIDHIYVYLNGIYNTLIKENTN